MQLVIETSGSAILNLVESGWAGYMELTWILNTQLNTL